MEKQSQRLAIWRNDRGATMVEYGLLVALIAVALIVAVVFFGDGLDALFGKAGNCMSDAAALG